jgi:hypothetical protein
MKELWMRFLTAKTEKELEMLTKESPVMASAGVVFYKEIK